MKKILLLATIVIALASCGKDKTEKEVTKKVEEIKKVETPKETTVVTEVKLALAGNDEMKFDKTEFKVKAGQKITLTLTHTGKFKKELMGHNFVLLKLGTDLPAFAEKAMAAKANDYIPSEGVIAHTTTIGGGETTSVTFTAPAKGTYDFICSFPGHYGMMKGKFIVE